MDTITCTCEDGLWCETHLTDTENAYRAAFTLVPETDAPYHWEVS